jgi:RimJ/RimL family protein N-acetyltransferase
MAIEIEVIKDKVRFSMLDTRMLLSHINALIGEHAYILTNHPFNLKEEAAWKHIRAEEIARKEKIIIVAREGGRIAGICEVRRGRGKEKYNMGFSMSVEKRYRGHGIGSMLLKRGIVEGKKTFKPHRIYLYYEEGNEKARELYEKLGFREVARLEGYVYHCGRFIDRILMEHSEKRDKHVARTRCRA